MKHLLYDRAINGDKQLELRTAAADRAQPDGDAERPIAGRRDNSARSIAAIAAVARQMPPSWRCGASHGRGTPALEAPANRVIELAFDKRGSMK